MGWFPGMSGSPVGLLYHGTPALDDAFVDEKAMEKHIAFLTRHFETVHPHEMNDPPGNKRRILLTFDDGYRNNIRIAAPILRRHRARATFFVCNRHTQPGKYLWFSYLRALERHFVGNGFKYHGELIDMSMTRRVASVQRLRKHLLSLRPHPAAMYLEIENQLPAIGDFVSADDLEMHYSGLSEEEIEELSNDGLFCVQAHTVDHPFLTLCDADEAFSQLWENKTWVQRITRKECSVLAYPSGDYDAGTVDLCRRIGFTQGLAVIPRKLNFPSYEIPRVGIFSKSLAVFAIKARFGHTIRKIGLRVG
jgi:peptidoglycan/xylan/chitin deacetylase (PgdA/CDA1 family)